jgi:hypothetical protein
MKKILRFCLLFLWMGFWAGICCRLYYENLDQMPHFPEAFWVALNKFFEVNNAESLETVEVFTIYGTMFLLLSVVHTIAFFAWRGMQQRKTDIR